MRGLGLQPVNESPVTLPDLFPLRMAGIEAAMREADAYLALVDTERPDRDTALPHRNFVPQTHKIREFEMAVKSRLPIGILVLESAASGAGARANRALKQFKDIYAQNGGDGFLAVRNVASTLRRSEIRAVLITIKSGLEHGAGIRVATPPIPDQSPAPVRVEERDGRVSRITDQDSALDAAERDFNNWREPVTDHMQELLLGDFRLGTNHGRARDRLVALATFLSATITEIKERQFRIGYEVERLGGLVSAYRSSGDDMPALSADVLEDLDRLRVALVMGISKLERWEAFHRAAAADSAHDGDANPTVVSKGLNEIAAEMERRPTYFDPELPETFRFLAEAATDPRGATRTVVYGAVRSAENLISFLGRKALGIGASTVGAVERHISKAVAATLIVALSGAALQISGALPTAWLWLRPLLEALARAGGG